MLTKLEFGLSVDQIKTHGLSIHRSPMTDEKADLIEVRIDPEHEFWKKHKVDPSGTRMFAVAELPQVGLYYGYSLSNHLDNFCLNYEEDCSHGMISKEGIIYTMDEVSEIYKNFQDKSPFLSTGKIRPNAPGQMVNQYGSADNIQQVLRKHRKMLMNPDQKFVIEYHVIDRETGGGYRWHKNGSYIGTKKPKHEYLRDDTHIDSIIQYNIILLKEKTKC